MAEFPFTLPARSGSNLFFETVAQLQLLPDIEGDKPSWTGLLKGIARMVIGAVVYPIFCILGSIYNGVAGILKLGACVFKHMRPKSAWFRGVNAHAAYPEAFKHLVYFGVDLVGCLFYPFVAGGFACAPQTIVQYYEWIQGETDQGHIWESVANRCGLNR